MNSVLITFVRCHLWAGEGQKLAFARNTAARVAAMLECNAMYDSKSDRNDMEHIAGASAHSRPPLAGTCHRYECTLASTSGRATSPRDGGAGTPSCLLLHHTLAQIAEMLVFGLDAADRLGVHLALLPTLLPLIGDAGRRRTAGRPTGCICLRHGLVVRALAPGGRSADTLAEQLEGVARERRWGQCWHRHWGRRWGRCWCSLRLHHTLAQIAEMLVFGLDAADRLGVHLALLPTLLPLIGDAGRRRTA